MNNKIKEQFKLQFIKNRIKSVENKLKSLEWIPLKVILNEWEETDQRYLDYLDERQRLRTRHQELLDELNILENV